MSESIVLLVGVLMSMSRLCVRISKCSRLSLSVNGLRSTQNRRTRVGSGTGPATFAPVRLTVSTIFVAELSRLRWSNDFSLMRMRGVAMAYLVILVTTPAPTVRPPSRIANLSPSSIAIGLINSTDNSTLSPGITISTPDGKLTTPVTSVVRK